MPSKILYPETGNHPAVYVIRRCDDDAGPNDWPDVGSIALSPETAVEMICRLANTTVADALEDYGIEIDPVDAIDTAHQFSQVLPHTRFEVDVLPLVVMDPDDIEGFAEHVGVPMRSLRMFGRV